MTTSDKDAAVWGFAFQGGRMLTTEAGEGTAVPTLETLAQMGISWREVHAMGEWQGRPAVALMVEGEAEADVDVESDGARVRPASLRSLHGRFGDEVFALAGRAYQILQWDRDHRHCGRCGTPTERRSGELARACPSCGLDAFPRISPAVIFLVHRGEEVLLARSPRLPDGMYSTLAGFVEPGESLEETVRRECFEEVGVRLGAPRYFGSQPWPFPHSLMVGFTVDWADGEIRIDPQEIEHAAWFHVDRLPRVPGRISIARALVDSWVRGLGRDAEALGP
jgi:NAD+ diphosphatase